MAGIVNEINLGVGNISHDTILGCYYQDITPGIVHVEKGIFAALDENGIPYTINGAKKSYAPIITIQYALMQYDFIVKRVDSEKSKVTFIRCLNWLEKRCESLADSMVIKNEANSQYGIPEGWVSGMIQGQLISVFLRGYQLLGDEKYLDLAHRCFRSFYIEYEQGGFRRVDEHGCVWFEEFATKKPSFVLNGFIYAMFGIYDYYRVTSNEDSKKLWNDCVRTLEVNLHKYDVWYWSVYDQAKKQLVSYYYQKNVHVPIMKIMFQLTGNVIFSYFATKWEKNLNNKFHRLLTVIMYRIKPRLHKLHSFLKN